MPSLKLVKRKELIRRLRRLGFEGPHSGGKHEYMVKGNLRLALPNPLYYRPSTDLTGR